MTLRLERSDDDTLLSGFSERRGWGSHVQVLGADRAVGSKLMTREMADAYEAGVRAACDVLGVEITKEPKA